MKKFFLISFVLLVGFVTQAFAQPPNVGPEWGETQEMRLQNVAEYGYMRRDIQNQDYGSAAFYLQNLLRNAPKGNIGIYTRGVQMYHARLLATQDRGQRAMYLDSLIMLSRKAIELFPPQNEQELTLRVSLIRTMAVEFKNVNPTDREGVVRHYRDAIELMGEHADPTVVLEYFNILATDYRDDLVSMEEFLLEFDRLMPIIQSVGSEEQVRQFEAILARSGAANCEGIERIYGNQIDERPDDLRLLETVITLLNRAGCTGTEFYLKVAELYYNVEPTANTALLIASYYSARGDRATAQRYYNQALNNETDPARRAGILISIAAAQLEDRNNQQAYNYARQATQLDSRNAAAFYIMATSIAATAQTIQDQFRRQTVNWLIVDNLQQARQLGFTAANIGNQIAQYQANFPSVEELFMRNLDEGATYTVSEGWITGQTTVRRRP